MTQIPAFILDRQHESLQRTFRLGCVAIVAVTGTKAKIPLCQAVTVAERHANGKASRAEHENSKQGWVHDVEVVSGAKVFDVRVDAEKGTVISSAENMADHDDEHVKRD